MSNKYSILLSVFFAIFLASTITSASAQAPDDQSRPRSLTNEPSAARQFASYEAVAEAKRLYKAGVKYGDARLFAQAASLFEQAIKLNPDYADAYASLGHAYFDLQQWDKAIPILEQALVLNPKHKESRNRLTAAREALEAERNKPTGDVAQRAAPSDAPLNGTQTNSTPTATKVADSESSLIKIYRIGPGDVLDVRFGETSSGTFTVGSTGLLEHPNLSQPLPVSGRTVEEIADRIQSTLTARAAAENAKVSVSVSDYVSHKILVSGLVKEPGPKILRREAIPLSVVIADAQRLPEAARAKVVRESNEVVTIDLANDTELNFLVRPGDVITLETEPAQFIYVGGEVKSPGEKTFRRGLTLTQAILIAGGLNGKAKEARLSRDSGNGFLVMTRYKLQDIDSGKRPDPVVEPGDRITVVK